ncbi:MAG: type II toxin-antitoxin system VapC family toxin [Halothece sp.]|jgi:tRNA(fMet)-specific endonuclease VapC
MSYLLDTNHFSRLVLGNFSIRQNIAEVGELNVAISIITEGEMLYMAYNSQRKQENLAHIQAYLKDIRIYPLNSMIAESYGQFKAELIRHFGPNERQKRRRTNMASIGISDNDLWIACTAIHHGLTIVSMDRDFSRMKEVMDFSLESWL